MVGNYHISEFLKRSYQTDRLFHVYLFSGHDALGKFYLAKQFAKFIFCDSPQYLQEFKSCGNCLNCNLFLKNQHPDYSVLEPQDDVISINALREILKNLCFKPLSAKYKILIINDAEKLTLEAQNNLLKTLEEPPAHSILILITSNKLKLLPTILSRAQILNFQLVSKLEIKQYLKKEYKISDSEAQDLSYLSEGRPGLAIKFLESESFKKDQENLVKDFIEIINGNFEKFFANLKNFDKNYVMRFLSVGRNLLRDVNLMKQGINEELFLNNSFDIKKLQDKFESQELIYHLQNFEKSIQNLENFNLNEKLLLEGTILQLI